MYIHLTQWKLSTLSILSFYPLSNNHLLIIFFYVIASTLHITLLISLLSDDTDFHVTINAIDIMPHRNWKQHTTGIHKRFTSNGTIHRNWLQMFILKHLTMITFKSDVFLSAWSPMNTKYIRLSSSFLQFTIFFYLQLSYPS